MVICSTDTLGCAPLRGSFRSPDTPGCALLRGGLHAKPPRNRQKRIARLTCSPTWAASSSNTTTTPILPARDNPRTRVSLPDGVRSRRSRIRRPPQTHRIAQVAQTLLAVRLCVVFPVRNPWRVADHLRHSPKSGAFSLPLVFPPPNSASTVGADPCVRPNTSRLGPPRGDPLSPCAATCSIASGVRRKSHSAVLQRGILSVGGWPILCAFCIPMSSIGMRRSAKGGAFGSRSRLSRTEELVFAEAFES
jgi:hypothetical protein